MDYIEVVGFGKFQHYKNRNPPWIKLHNSILENIAFGDLNDEHKAHLMLIWLLASRMEKGLVPADPKWIGRKIGATSKIHLETLTQAGFIRLAHSKNNASNALAECLQDACAEGEGEGETEERQRRGESEEALCASSVEVEAAFEECKPIEERIVDLWNTTTSAPIRKCAKITPARLKLLKAALKEHPEFAEWETAIAKVAASDFCNGRIPGRDGHEPFVASFDPWFIGRKYDSIQRALEGAYDNRKPVHKPGGNAQYATAPDPGELPFDDLPFSDLPA